MVSSIENRNIPITQERINDYFIQARTIARDWGKKLAYLYPEKLSWYYRYYWQKYNRRNGIRQLN